MGNGYKQGQLDAFDPHANYDSYDDEDEYSDDMDSPMAKKYGQSVSPSRPMFDPYQSVYIHLFIISISIYIYIYIYSFILEYVK